VSILKAPFSEYDIESGLLIPGAKNSVTEIMFLNTDTMGLRNTLWQERVEENLRMINMLCPAMRRLPNIGSLTTELVIAGVSLVRFTVNMIVSLPGLIQIWRNEQKCAMVTHGHSLLQKCGSDLLSMDDFFEAIDRANSHFWRSFSIISDRIRGLGHGSDYVANIIDGAAKFGQSSVVPLSDYNFLIKTIKLPISEFGVSSLKSLSIISPITTSIAAPNPIRIAQFSYKFITDIITQIIPLAIKIDRNPNDVASSRFVLFIFVSLWFRFGSKRDKTK
jgi:hypothetical protein